MVACLRYGDRRQVFGRETFIKRVGDGALALRMREGDYAWVDGPAVGGRLVSVWADDPGSTTLVRVLSVVDGRRALRATNPVLDPTVGSLIGAVLVTRFHHGAR